MGHFLWALSKVNTDGALATKPLEDFNLFTYLHFSVTHKETKWFEIAIKHSVKQLIYDFTYCTKFFIVDF